MNRWIPYAFVRIAIFFMLGISISIFYPNLLDANSARLICLTAFVFYVVIVIRMHRRPSITRAANLKVYAGTVGLCAIFFGGISRVGSNTSSNNAEHIIHSDSIDFLKIVVSTAAIEKENSWKAEGEVNEIHRAGQWKFATGRIMLYLSKKEFASPPEYGKVLLVRAKALTCGRST